MRVLEEEWELNGGWQKPLREWKEKRGDDVKEEGEITLSDEEKEIVETLEAEMGIEEEGEVKMEMEDEEEETKPLKEEFTNGFDEEMLGQRLMDTATRAAQNDDPDEWWNSLKRKRENDL